VARIPYDEFGLFHENAAEVGLVLDGPPVVRRERVDLGDGRQLSALIWGDSPPELVLLHGGAQNAHTWDSVALLLGRPLVAIDLPGHGHSDGARVSGSLTSIQDLAADVAVAVRALAPDARAVVGMSLGGMTTLGLYDHAPELVRRIVLVDVLPSANPDKAKLITDFVNGPPSFASFEDLLARTIEHNPTRMESSLRRGILHNAVQLDDGSWVWRHARHRATAPAEAGAAPAEAGGAPAAPPEQAAEAAQATEPAAERTERFAWLWDVLSGVEVPLLLVRGMAASSVVDDEHEDELRRRLPGAQVERVEGAGHSVQGDKPVVLAGIIADFVP
jgi:pimeloyl-ACP methyl ester carboxylesterase